MATHLTVLMGATALLLVISCFVVAYGTPILKKGWHFETERSAGKGHPDGIPVRDVDILDVKEVSPMPSKRPRHPLAVGIEDLSVGDVVYVETRSGSRYAFELADAETSRFRLKGVSASQKRYFDMDVCVFFDFVPGNNVAFYATDRDWKCVTSPVKRILVERHSATVGK